MTTSTTSTDPSYTEFLARRERGGPLTADEYDTAVQRINALAAGSGEWWAGERADRQAEIDASYQAEVDASSTTNRTNGWITLTNGNVLLDDGVPVRVSVTEQTEEVEREDGGTGGTDSVATETADLAALRDEVEILTGRWVEAFDAHSWSSAEGDGESVCPVVLSSVRRAADAPDRVSHRRGVRL
jgi:hypothetical protein